MTKVVDLEHSFRVREVQSREVGLDDQSREYKRILGSSKDLFSHIEPLQDVQRQNKHKIRQLS
jgi:hypothetical protein